MLYLGFGQVNVLIVPVYLVQKALVLQFKLVKQLVERLIYFKPQRPLLAVRKLQNVLRMVVRLPPLPVETSKEQGGHSLNGI